MMHTEAQAEQMDYPAGHIDYPAGHHSVPQAVDAQVPSTEAKRTLEGEDTYRDSCEEERESRQGQSNWNARATPAFYWWHRIDPGEGPATRGRHTVGLDPVRNSLVMFGGQNYDLRRKYNDIAKYDLNTDKWSYVHSEEQGPCVRSSHACVATKDALYIFGGATGKSFMASPGCCKDAFTWRYGFENSTWTKVNAEGLDAVSSRYGHTTVLTPNDVVYLFGGMTDTGCDWNTFRIDLVNLKVERLECSFIGTEGDVCGPLPDNGAQPPGVASISSISPPVDTAPPPAQPDTTQASSSSAPNTPTSDTTDPDKIKTAQQVRDCVRGFGHTAIYNPYTDSMYVLGGTVDGRKYHSTFLRLDLKTSRWMLEEAVNKPPEGRYVHCASYDVNRNAMYIFGGYCGAYRNDIHEYDFNTKRWTEIKPHPLSPEGPCLRSGACSVVSRDHVYIFGGCDDARYYNDVWKLRLWNDTISLKDTMLDWMAWQRAKGPSPSLFGTAPPAIIELLSKRQEVFNTLAAASREVTEDEKKRLADC